MKFYLKDSAIFMKDTALALNGEPLPLIRDQQASNEVLRYIMDHLPFELSAGPAEGLSAAGGRLRSRLK